MSTAIFPEPRYGIPRIPGMVSTKAIYEIYRKLASDIKNEGRKQIKYFCDEVYKNDERTRKMMRETTLSVTKEQLRVLHRTIHESIPT